MAEGATPTRLKASAIPGGADGPPALPRTLPDAPFARDDSPLKGFHEDLQHLLAFARDGDPTVGV